MQLTKPKRPASIVIDSATYLLMISSPDIDNIAMSLYDIMLTVRRELGIESSLWWIVHRMIAWVIKHANKSQHFSAMFCPSWASSGIQYHLYRTRTCSPDEACDEQNIALKCCDLLACLIAPSNNPTINSSTPNNFKLTLHFHVIVNKFKLLNKGTGWLNAVHCIKAKSTEKQVENVPCSSWQRATARNVLHPLDRKLQYCSSVSCCIYRHSYEPLQNQVEIVC